ncbi:poly-gamma-glutamate synthesis protein (capsule biosynthesis protein) [Branchiibius hedensis]|uniref:Poly-gamma-glutamate synthesis protein (Capsule biosynthesis protein) n=1 Tax=Branchiibius hedensis TaxID=672460 RepID=A0A2Y9BTE0_9MICO|nr:CapA family protein [Branchiibius hedensis]PWJ25077.1 poly-gamma-glutamate synthesis protein (capsule biosynthesis protein) [Branchiibius hedensis]SSA33892.1 poly-gamma-glutamate synthesis protein (capsule biosynthesis protein) [Branchiibius hedensis]
MRALLPAAACLSGLLALGACSNDSGKPPAAITSAPAASSAGSSSSTPGSDVATGTTVTVAASGDILIHGPVRRNAAAFAKQQGKTGFDFDPMFAPVKAALSKADVTICQQETPVSANDTNLEHTGLVYNAPKEIAAAEKKAGFDGCSFASNHTWDMQLAGVQQTPVTLERAGLKVAGATPTASGAGEPAIYQVGKVKVAQFAYAYSVINKAGPSPEVPSSAPWLKDASWPAEGVTGILAEAKKAKAAGADIVVISMHWGKEYQEAPTSEQTTYAKALLASPYVDAIYGAHAHVIQPCSTLNGKYVFYGMGNFLSNQGQGQASILTDANADGVIPTVTFTKTANGWSQTATYQPTHVDIAGHHIINLTSPTQNPTAYGRVVKAMSSLGNCQATPVG